MAIAKIDAGDLRRRGLTGVRTLGRLNALSRIHSIALLSGLALLGLGRNGAHAQDARGARPGLPPAVVPFETEAELRPDSPEEDSPASDAEGAQVDEAAVAPAVAPTAGPRRTPARRAAASRAAASPREQAPQAAPEAPVRTDHDLRPLASSPVPGVESSGFGWRDDPFNNRRKFHKGTDFRAPRGTAVYAAGAGVVSFAGRMGGYGKVIFIDHGDGVITRYGHLSSIGVAKGAVIASGHKVGEVGATGRATGPHLHFEVRLDGRAVNPKVAMTVATLQRTDPAAARVAAAALAPEVQAASVDPHKVSRPERRGRSKRTQALW